MLLHYMTYNFKTLKSSLKSNVVEVGNIFELTLQNAFYHLSLCSCLQDHCFADSKQKRKTEATAIRSNVTFQLLRGTFYEMTL